MNTTELEEIAEALRNARISRVPISPPTKSYPSLDQKGAFQIQRITAQHAIEHNGDRLVGYKLGNIAKVMQGDYGGKHG